MGNSYSNLGNYVRKLLSDDAALKAFLVDPIGEAEGKNGLTKAERAVLRRTVFHLSNNSKNGYSLERHLGSYRRSLRLLQNVLDNYGSKAVMDHISNSQPSDSGATGLYAYSVVVYSPNVSGDTNFTNQTNDDVNSIGGPYANSKYTFTTLGSETSTIGAVMNQLSSLNLLSFETVDLKDPQGNTQPYVSEITIGGYQLTADLSQYKLSDDYIFWFYSVNGAPNVDHNPVTQGTTGDAGESYLNYPVQAGETIYWQLIAPDKAYGFQPCT